MWGQAGGKSQHSHVISHLWLLCVVIRLPLPHLELPEGVDLISFVPPGVSCAWNSAWLRVGPQSLGGWMDGWMGE